MDLNSQMQIEWACQKLCQEFAYCIDRRRYEQLVNLFTEDGVFDRVGQLLRGRVAILEALQKRSLDLRTRHVLSNIYFVEVDGQHARALIYNTTLVGRGDPEAAPAPYGMSQGAFLEFQDLYRKTPEGWRIAERIARTVLTPEDMPKH